MHSSQLNFTLKIKLRLWLKAGCIQIIEAEISCHFYWLIRSPTAANPHQKNCIFVESTMTLMIKDWRREGRWAKLVWLILRTCLWSGDCLESKVPTTKFG
jgi:hypothetical protein